MGGDHIDIRSGQSGGGDEHGFLIGGSVSTRSQIQRNILLGTVENNGQRVVAAVLGTDNNPEFIVTFRLDRGIVGHFAGLGVDGIAAVFIIDRYMRARTNDDLDRGQCR